MADTRSTILLLPGADGTGRLFEPLQEALGSDVETVVVSYPGGDSQDYDALRPLIEAQIPDGRFAIVAESFSGPVALSVAARRPAGLQALILSASYATGPRPYLTSLLARLVGLPVLPRRLPLWMIRAFLLNPDTSPALCRYVQETVASVDPAVIAARLRVAATCNVIAALRDCPVPLYYLNATQDRLLPRSALETLAREKPDLTVVDVPGPHLLLQACPEICARHILEMLPSLQIG